METKLVRIALYARVSTKDKGHDYENQLRELREFVTRRASDGWVLAHEYVDKASGKSSDRPVFKRPFEEASRRKSIWSCSGASTDSLARGYWRHCSIFSDSRPMASSGLATGVGEALSPLVGVWAPTFSACELAAVFLLPFVAIRLVGGDRQSGALKLELQHPMPALAKVAAKASVLLVGWLAASIAPIVAIALWRSYGGTTYAPELATVASGHLLNAGLTIGLAAAVDQIQISGVDGVSRS